MLGSNKATEDKIKLFPRDCKAVVDKIQSGIYNATGKVVEVMVYGDGAFKDPVGKIWELADPVVSPAFTNGLAGRPNEIKLKYLADNDFAHLSGEELKEANINSVKLGRYAVSAESVSDGIDKKFMLWESVEGLKPIR